MRAPAVALLSTLCLLALSACGGPRDDGERAAGALETVDVGAPPDVLVDPENDPVEPRRAEGALAGVLPSDFPAELPAPQGASVVDLGERAVVFLVPEALPAVRSRYGALLRGRGWADDGDNAYRRNDVRVGVTLERQGPSTRVTVSY